MDKASIIKDTIDYIQTLHDQQKTIQAELMELESRKLEPKTLEFNQEAKFLSMERSKKFRVEQAFDSSGSSWYPIEVRDVSSFLTVRVYVRKEHNPNGCPRIYPEGT
nr:transcription factor bHLH35-like [Tanacetum cinerariifolium]